MDDYRVDLSAADMIAVEQMNRLDMIQSPTVDEQRFVSYLLNQVGA